MSVMLAVGFSCMTLLYSCHSLLLLRLLSFNHERVFDLSDALPASSQDGHAVCVLHSINIVLLN